MSSCVVASLPKKKEPSPPTPASYAESRKEPATAASMYSTMTWLRVAPSSASCVPYSWHVVLVQWYSAGIVCDVRISSPAAEAAVKKAVMPTVAYVDVEATVEILV